MKKRLCFVSNSSSSSFIVTKEDNKFDICFSDYKEISLKEYCEDFLERDTIDWIVFNGIKIEDFNFVSDQKFNKMFGKSIRKTFPNSCKELLNDYINIYTNRPNTNWDSKEYDDYYKKLDIVRDKIIKNCIKSLQSGWKTVKFHYAEIDDHWIESKDCDMVSLTEHKIEYLKTLKEFKFLRIFSNH